MFQMQVKVEVEKNKKDWRSIRPTGGKPYEYETKKEAWDMLRSCYPDVFQEDLRVIEV